MIPVVTFQDLAENIKTLAEAVPELEELAVTIGFVNDVHADDWTGNLTPDDHGAVLKALTGLVVSLQINVACYPTGYTTAILFDMDGEPV